MWIVLVNRRLAPAIDVRISLWTSPYMRSWIPLSPCAETRLFVEIPCFASISGCPCSHEALSLYILFCIRSWYPNLIRYDLITFFRLNSHLLFDLLRLNAFQSHFYVVFCIYRFLACPSIDPSICGLPLNFSVRTFIGPFLLAINCAEAGSLRTMLYCSRLIGRFFVFIEIFGLSFCPFLSSSLHCCFEAGNS